MENHNFRPMLTSEQWEERLGQQVRDLRLRQNITQAELARRANIDRTTVTRLEHGEGGSVRSLIGIARGLDREEWLDAFLPPEATVSPMQLLRDQNRDTTRRQRARRRSGATE